MRRCCRALAMVDLGDHPVPAADDREVLGQLDVEPFDHACRAPRRSSSIAVAPNRCSQRASDLAEQRRRDLLRLPARRAWGGRTTLARALERCPNRLASTSEAGRSGLRADEHVAPALHAAQRRECSGLRDARGGRKLADGDAVTDEPHEVRPHHHRDRQPAADVGRGQPVVEFVVELDREVRSAAATAASTAADRARDRCYGTPRTPGSVVP